MVSQHIFKLVYIALTLFLLGGFADARDQLDEPVMLVATPELKGQFYGSSILIVTPIGNRQHIGFIINRPTPVKLSEMFPQHEPSKKVLQPIYLGGPVNVEILFALVKRNGHADSSGIKLASDLYLEIERERVDGVIEKEPDHARFFAGVVIWQPGELEAEVRNDYWYVQDADVNVVLRKSTTGLWEELIKRIERNKNSITAGSALRFSVC